MAHMLATLNPEAAHEIDHPAALPDVGAMVVYCPRPGEVRAGRTRVPAMVIKSDVGNRLLDLVVVYDADDFLSKRRIPRKTGDDHGWEPADGSADAVLEKLEAFKSELAEVLFGAMLKPKTPILHLVYDLKARVDALEAKRGPGRPPNPVKAGED